MYEEQSGESSLLGEGKNEGSSPPRKPPSSRLEPKLVSKDGECLQVLGIARISTVHQDAKSLNDQEALYRSWLNDHTDGPFHLTMISSRGSGELLDRKELRQAEELVETGRLDLVLAEDLGRISRRIYAASFCEFCEDCNTRLVAINDYVDTAKEDWRLHSFFATMRHETYNRDTAKRIRRTSRNRFMQGGMVQTVISCYRKPPGMKSDEQLEKIPETAPYVEGIFERLEKDWTYSEVGDWLNNNNVPLGKWCRSKKWTGAMVRRIVIKEPRNNKLPDGGLGSRVNLIVPFAMEGIGLQMTLSQFFVGDFTSFFIGRFVEPSVNFQAGSGGRMPNRLDDDFASLQRDALPVARDVTEQPMFVSVRRTAGGPNAIAGAEFWAGTTAAA